MDIKEHPVLPKMPDLGPPPADISRIMSGSRLVTAMNAAKISQQKLADMLNQTLNLENNIQRYEITYVRYNNRLYFHESIAEAAWRIILSEAYKVSPWIFSTVKKILGGE